MEIKEKIKGKKKFLIYTTPRGELIEELKQSSDGAWRVLKFLAKTPEDIEKAIWLYENISYIFVRENFERGNEFVGARGEPQFFLPRSGYQHLALCVAQDRAKEKTYKALAVPMSVNHFSSKRAFLLGRFVYLQSL